jgi:hypothetical protein
MNEKRRGKTFARFEGSGGIFIGYCRIENICMRAKLNAQAARIAQRFPIRL